MDTYSMSRFYFYETIWSVYLILMLHSMHIDIELFVLLKCEYLNFKLQF
jgi:hypothetical protein